MFAKNSLSDSHKTKKSVSRHPPDFRCVRHGSRPEAFLRQNGEGSGNRSAADREWVTRRELDTSRAAHSIAYTQGSMNFRREHFASHP
jgi:hypothetical protein